MKLNLIFSAIAIAMPYLVSSKPIAAETKSIEAIADNVALQSLAIYNMAIKDLSAPEQLVNTKTRLCGKFELKFKYVSPLHKMFFALYEGEKYYILIFKGTTNLREIFTIDLDFRKPSVKLDDQTLGFMHNGFKKAFEDLEPGLKKLNDDIKLNSGKKIILSGFSLGGTFAKLLAFNAQQFENINDRIGAVITFGAPAFGNDKVAAAYKNVVKAATFEYYLQNDPSDHDFAVNENRNWRHVDGELVKRIPVTCKLKTSKAQECGKMELHSSEIYEHSIAQIVKEGCNAF